VDEAVVDENGNYLDEEGNIIRDKQGNPITSPEGYEDKIARTDPERIDPEDEEAGNNYHLIPGKSYPKDPTMTVVEGSEESYVRMIVTVNCVEALDELFAKYASDASVTLESIFGGYDDNVWPLYGVSDDTDENGKVTARTYEFRYSKKVTGAAEGEGHTKLEPLFDTLTVPGVFTGEDLAKLEGFELIVTGNAIQATFDSADAAWAAFETAA